MSNWRQCTVGDLVKEKIIAPPMDGNHGDIHPKGNDFVEYGIPFVMASDINDSYINLEACKFISKKQADGLRKGFAIQGDVLLTHKATIGRTAIVPEIKSSYLMLTPQVTYYRVIDDKILDNRFLKYHFDSKPFQETLGLWAGAGSTRAYLGILGQHNLSLRMPDLQVQKGIADTLSTLDAKIDLNNRINTELEAMAKTLYDYWFVQFDFPNTNGKPYKTSGGKMTYNSILKREIPVGWGSGTLLDIATFTNGLACQKFRPKNEQYYRVIKIREMGAGFTENSELVTVNIPEKVIVNNGDILFSWSATLDVKIWSGGKGALNQHIFKITSKKYPKSYYYFQLLNYLQHFKMIAELRKTTMGHITQEHLQQSVITIPPIDLITQLDEAIKPILEKKVKLEEESQQLSQLRDWLLPMLMNGQVKVQ